MEIRGTVVRAYVGENLTGSNGRFNGQPCVHVVPADPQVLHDLDGSHQAGAGEVRVICKGAAPKIGDVVTFDVDEEDAADGSAALVVTFASPKSPKEDKPSKPPTP